MGTIVNVIVLLGSIFPAWLVTIVLGMLALILIFIVVKIVAFVLDAIPFL